MIENVTILHAVAAHVVDYDWI